MDRRSLGAVRTIIPWKRLGSRPPISSSGPRRVTSVRGDVSGETSAAVGEATAGSDESRTRGWLQRALLLAVGTGLLVVYLRGLDYGALLSAAEAFPVAVAVAVVAINVLPGAIKYLRWRHFLDARGLGIEGFKGYLAVNASFFHGLVTPGTAGELSRAWVSESDEAGKATAVVAFEKLTDLVVLVLLVAVSAAVQFTGGGRSWAVVGVACLAVLGGYALFVRYDRLLTTPLKLLLRHAVSDDRRESLRDAYWEFYELVEDRRLVVLSVVASAALWLVTLAQMQLIVAGLGWDLAFKTTAVALFLPYLAGVVSLIPLGLGVFELMMARVAQVDLLVTTVEGAAIGPLFFRFLVTVPLVLGGYLCHLALTLTRWRNQ